jgi:hypothetical protein
MSNAVYCFLLLSDNTLLAGCACGAIDKIDYSKNKKVHTFYESINNIYDMCLVGEPNTIACVGPTGVHMLNYGLKRIQPGDKVNGRCMNCCSYFKENIIILVDQDSNMLLYDYKKCEKIT